MINPATADSENPRWHILGPGAIGSLFAAYLQSAGAAVTLIDHSNADEQARTLTMSGQEPTGSFTFPVSPADATATLSHVLVTTKAYNVAPAIDSVRHRLSAETAVVVIVNGMGVVETLGQHLNHARFYLGTTTEGAYRTSSTSIFHAGSGTTLLGAANKAVCPAWFSSFDAALPDCRWQNDIHSSLWRKLAINAAINPLTALLRCKNGALATEHAAEVRELCREISQVATAAGLTHVVADLEAIVFDVIDRTAGNRSSMLQDVEAGRQTEIDFITGWLIAQADQLAVPVPHNRELFNALKSIHG